MALIAAKLRQFDKSCRAQKKKKKKTKKKKKKKKKGERQTELFHLTRCSQIMLGVMKWAGIGRGRGVSLDHRPRSAIQTIEYLGEERRQESPETDGT